MGVDVVIALDFIEIDHEGYYSAKIEQVRRKKAGL